MGCSIMKKDKPTKANIKVFHSKEKELIKFFSCFFIKKLPVKLKEVKNWTISVCQCVLLCINRVYRLLCSFFGSDNIVRQPSQNLTCKFQVYDDQVPVTKGQPSIFLIPLSKVTMKPTNTYTSLPFLVSPHHHHTRGRWFATYLHFGRWYHS